MASRSRRRRSALFCWFGDPALLVQTEAASTPELLRPGQGHPPACSGSADAHQLALLDPRWLPSATGSAGATTCWRRSSANYCQASARRDMIMGARMCAQGTSGLLRDAWLGSASACEFSVIFCTNSTCGSGTNSTSISWRLCFCGLPVAPRRTRRVPRGATTWTHTMLVGIFRWFV